MGYSGCVVDLSWDLLPSAHLGQGLELWSEVIEELKVVFRLQEAATAHGASRGALALIIIHQQVILYGKVLISTAQLLLKQILTSHYVLTRHHIFRHSFSHFFGLFVFLTDMI